MSFWIQKPQNSRRSNKVVFISLETQRLAGMVDLNSSGTQAPSSPLFHYSLAVALILMVQDGCWNSTHYHFAGKEVPCLPEVPQCTSVHILLVRTLATWKGCRGDWEMQSFSWMHYAQQKTLAKDPCN